LKRIRTSEVRTPHESTEQAYSCTSDSDSSSDSEEGEILQLLSTCEELSSQIMSNLRCWTDDGITLKDDISPREIARFEAMNQPIILEQPACIPSELKLKPYQLCGLNWAKLLHHMDTNGIIAVIFVFLCISLTSDRMRWDLERRFRH
jgi:hypothetical protein